MIGPRAMLRDQAQADLTHQLAEAYLNRSGVAVVCHAMARAHSMMLPSLAYWRVRRGPTQPQLARRIAMVQPTRGADRGGPSPRQIEIAILLLGHPTSKRPIYQSACV